ncbi:MAG: ABC transporter ATP-binding protein [Pikeienuella sp.]
MTPLLSVQDLRVAFGETEAVHGLSFDIAPGETLALVGESGSGKSASAMAILRLIEREGGRVVAGRMLFDRDGEAVDLAALDEAEMSRIRGREISMVFQEPMTSLNPVLTIGDQVAEVYVRHRKMRPAEALEAAGQALARVAIPEPARRLRQYPHELSGGLRQRVMIAMALACRPKLLIADEPSTALDVTTQAEILTLMKSLQAEIGMAVLFITHDMAVVAQIADRVVVMKGGDRMEEAPKDRLFAAPRSDYARMLMAASPRLGAGSPEYRGGGAPVLSVEKLSTSFAGRRGARAHVVRGVSLEIREGETLGLVGESGCGKSTFARSALRLIEPQEGAITLDGERIDRADKAALRRARRKAQLVFQDPYASLNPRMAVRDLITEPARIHGLVSARDSRDLAAELVARVGLPEDAVDRYPHQFSGGQRQRLCIARALSVKPRLIIADESVSALDVSIARQITDLMRELQEREGLSFLFISHDIAVVERVSHRIGVMYRGELVEMGETQAVLTAPREDYTRRLLEAVPRLPAPPRADPRPAARPRALSPA